jgi:hypothetical protein
MKTGMTETRNWISLTHHLPYEITVDEPWEIRRKNTKGKYRMASIWRNKKTGYYEVSMAQKSKKLHRIICEQFIPNPDNLPICDHKNRDITDNRLENLRWTTHLVNACNRTGKKDIKYTFLSQLPSDSIPFTDYEMRMGDIRKFDNLYLRMENQTPQFITSDSENQYRVLYNQNNHVKYNDTSGKSCSICFSRIQEQITQAQQKSMDIQKTIAETQKTMAETQKIMAETLQQQILLRK